MTRRAELPVAVWAGVLAGTSVLAVAVVAGSVLAVAGRLDEVAVEALSAGTVGGLVVVLLCVVAATRLAASLRTLHSDALLRLQEPSAPLNGRSLTARATLEVAELARVLDALHLRVRVADELGERHRRDAETAGAGVFELLSGLVAAEEGARGQLAAELHDTVAQSLMIARGLLAVPADIDLVTPTD
ncbi:MAG: hypothetical protein H7233_06840 [Pseudorhodobacter sp.]|nr:hypothetical protein [Frankiaceae bacterium]